MRLDTYYHASIEIENDNWNNLLKDSGQSILHNTSLQTLKQVFHKGIPGHDNSHLDANQDF